MNPSFYSQYDHEKSLADVTMYNRAITPPNMNGNMIANAHGIGADVNGIRRPDQFSHGYRDHLPLNQSATRAVAANGGYSGNHITHPSMMHGSIHPSPHVPLPQHSNPSISGQRSGFPVNRGQGPGHSVHGKGNDNVTLNCHYCGGLFGTRTELRSHLFNYCTKRQFILSNGACRDCGGTFAEFLVYTSHIEVCRRSKRPDKSKPLSLVVENEPKLFSTRSVDTTDSEPSSFTMRTSPSMSSSSNTSPVSLEGTLYFGGYVNPETLASASAWWIADAAEVVIAQGSAPVNLDMNSSIYRVEYEGLLHGLLTAIQHNVKKLVVRGSSEIVNQFTSLEEIAFLRSIQTSEKDITDYILKVIPKFQRIEFVKIPLERNHYVRMIAEDASFKFQRRDLSVSTNAVKMPVTTGHMTSFSSSVNHFPSEGPSRSGSDHSASVLHQTLSYASAMPPMAPPGLTNDYSSSTSSSWYDSQGHDALIRGMLQKESPSVESLRTQLNPFSDPVVDMGTPKLPDWLSYAHGSSL